MYLYRAIDSVGDTVEFWLPSAKRFFRKALARHGRPERAVIDGSQTNQEAIVSCDITNRFQDRSRRRLKPIRIRKSKYLNNRIEDRTGPSAHQAPHPVNARLQTTSISPDHPKRHRNGSHDA
nr:DDE-type integrase/transposase/recombinase [Mesorhizobium sp. L48C026A00]